jgi:hypothetical protein
MSRGSRPQTACSSASQRRYSSLAVRQTVGLATPYTDGVLHWAQRAMKRNYLTGQRIDGADVAGLPLPGRFGITDAGSLLRAAL